MTYVNFNKPAGKPFNNLMDDFFANVPSLIREEFPGLKNGVAANVYDQEAQFQIEIVAPGFSKEDFSINLNENILTIEGTQKENEEKINGKEIRKEYKFKSFKRSFTINEKVDVSAIGANYLNGVLTLNLPKKSEVKPATQQIQIQ